MGRLQRGKGGAGECGLLAGPPSYPVVSASPSPPSPPSPSPAPPAPPSPTPSSYYWYWDSAKRAHLVRPSLGSARRAHGQAQSPLQCHLGAHLGPVTPFHNPRPGFFHIPQHSYNYFVQLSMH